MLVKIHTVVARVARHVGRRGAYLSFLAALDVLFAVSLLTPLPLKLSAKLIYQPMIAVAPLKVWACWWLATAIVCAVSVVAKRLRIAAFTAAVGLKLAWAATYVVGWIDHMPAYARGWQSAAIWGFFGLVTALVSGWRENGQ